MGKPRRKWGRKCTGGGKRGSNKERFARWWGEKLCNIAWYLATKKIQRGGVNATKRRWELGLKGTESGKFEALCPLLPPPPNILRVKWY